MQPHRGLHSGGDNMAIRPDCAGTFFIFTSGPNSQALFKNTTADPVMHHRMQYSVHLLTDWTLLSGSSQEKKCITAAGAPWKSLCEEPMKPLALKCHPIQGHRYQAYTCTICIYTIHQNIVCCFLTPLSAWHIPQKQHSDGFALKSY